MADLSKADKIAAGYKKLKEFQKKNKKSDTKAQIQMNNDEFSSINISEEHKNNEENINDTKSVQTFNETTNVFSSNEMNQQFNNNINFFDYNISQFPHITPERSNIVEPSNSSHTPSLQSYFNDNSQNTFDHMILNDTKSSDNNLVIDNQFNSNFANVNINNDTTTFTEFNTIYPENVKQEDLENDKSFENINTVTQNEPCVENIDNSDLQVPNTNLSSVENILQLSSEIKKFVDSNDMPSTYLQTTQQELEYRNQELAGMLESRNIEVAQLTSRLQEYFNRIQDLETQLRTNQIEMTTKVQEELHPLKEQLEHHAKTIGLLYAEKSELSATLEQNQAILKEKICENEEIQCKLRASRHRANDLERETANLKAKLEESKNLLNSNENINMLKLELAESKKRNEEFVDEISELTQKLSTVSQESLSFKEQLVEKSNQLSLLELKFHQICNNGTSQLEFQIEDLTKEKLAMQLKINHLAEQLKSLSLEKDKSNEQYQQYVSQLNEQIKTFSNQNDLLTKENDKLKKRENDLILHVSNLEKEIQTLYKQKNNSTEKELPNQKEHELEEKISTLENTIQERSKEVHTLLEEKKDLLKELENRNYQIVNLEGQIVDLENDKPNIARLSAIMESDKVAAAQAIKQNAKLTKQVEELQDKLIEITQRELSLTEKFNTEQHLGQEILKQLKSRESELDVLKEQFDEKNNYILQLEKQKTEENINEQLTLIKPVQSQTQSNQTDLTMDNNNFDESALTKNNVCNKCIENERKLEKMEAMNKLEERFKKTMEEIVRLTDEKLELEHIITQLQSETETIGEYIALYQFQRGVLKQRSIEKDEELRMLNQEREHMRQKLSELSNLVQQFIPEKTNNHTQVNHDECNLTDDNIEDKRAGKLMELINEISTSRLIESNGDVSHVCPWCSGQLITV